MIPVDDIPDNKTPRERTIGIGTIGSVVIAGVDSTARKITNRTRETAMYV
jgi:hypothetical protein